MHTVSDIDVNVVQKVEVKFVCPNIAMWGIEWKIPFNTFEQILILTSWEIVEEGIKKDKLKVRQNTSETI